MNLKNITRWNARVSLVYAVGIWTMFGAFGYYQMNHPRPRKEDEQQNLSDTAPAAELEPEEKKPKDFVTSTIYYRDGFVPYSSQIFSFIKSLINDENGTK